MKQKKGTRYTQSRPHSNPLTVMGLSLHTSTKSPSTYFSLAPCSNVKRTYVNSPFCGHCSKDYQTVEA
jgi:hypothetical protein